MTLRAALVARATLFVATALPLGGCSGADRSERTLVAVYAASSLTEAFGEMETLFERAHPEADVVITFAGSQILRIQIEEGAPAHVFASANSQHMDALIEGGLVPEGRVFAHNELVVVVPLDGRVGIETFSQLSEARRVVLGTSAVPVGRYARDALAAADSHVRPGFRAAVMEHVVSEESNARLARAKVELGEADAAIVYRTDAFGSNRVRTIPIPSAVNVRADYLIGVVERRQRFGLAEAWIETVLSPEGRAVLERHGFRTRPSEPAPAW